MNRIDQKFVELRKHKAKALIAYLTAGYPSLKMTEELVPALEAAGADIIELGVPFSDPMADGPTIQASSLAALKKNVSLQNILDLVARLRKKTEVPIALMTYYNPVYHYGVARFVKAAQLAGVDGVVIPDLPPEEAKELITLSRKARLSTVFFMAPTTVKERMNTVIQASTGFIYYVSLTGVTGSRKNLDPRMLANIKVARQKTKKPICVGFGISTPQQVKQISRLCDGVVVGSAIIKEIEISGGSVKRVAGFVKRLKQAL